MDAHVGKLKLPGSYKLVNNITRAWERIQDIAAHLYEGRDESYKWERAPRTIYGVRSARWRRIMFPLTSGGCSWDTRISQGPGGSIW